MSIFSDIFLKIRTKVSNAEKPDTKTVTFDSDGNVVNYPSGNPTDGTPEEIKKLAKKLYEKVEKLTNSK